MLLLLSVTSKTDSIASFGRHLSRGTRTRKQRHRRSNAGYGDVQLIAIALDGQVTCLFANGSAIREAELATSFKDFFF